MKVQNQKEPSCSDSSLTYLFYNLLPIARRSIGDYPSGDDIYTPKVNVDEDCAQALLDAGAKRVILYVIGYTQHNN